MLKSPRDILELFPIRKTKKQKQVFRDAVCCYLQNLGYAAAVENGSFGSRNIVIGDPENARYLVTAHYDTPAKLLFPNFITPCNAFVFFGRKILQWFGIILLAGLVGAAGGLVFGPVWIAPFCTAALVGLIVLMFLGTPNPANANDNTSGVVTLLEIAKSLPKTQRNKVCFVLFDLEEAGLIGSSSYRKIHKKATDQQLVLNLDCVGDGDHILMIPTAKLKKDKKQLTSLYKACGYFGKKSLLLKDKVFSVYPSDQRCFPYGVGICALNTGKFGLFLSRIHTPKDMVLDMTNVNILRAAIVSYICCNAAN